LVLVSSADVSFVDEIVHAAHLVRADPQIGAELVEPMAHSQAFGGALAIKAKLRATESLMSRRCSAWLLVYGACVARQCMWDSGVCASTRFLRWAAESQFLVRMLRLPEVGRVDGGVDSATVEPWPDLGDQNLSIANIRRIDNLHRSVATWIVDCLRRGKTEHMKISSQQRE
jgi:hypothetical protein